MDHETVSIFIEKLNEAKETIKTTAPHEPAFSIANQNIISIEKALRQSGLIQLYEQWVYPDAGWTSSRIIDLTDAGFKFLSEDFTARTIDGRTINGFLAPRHKCLASRYARKQYFSSHLQSGSCYEQTQLLHWT